MGIRHPKSNMKACVVLIVLLVAVTVNAASMRRIRRPPPDISEERLAEIEARVAQSLQDLISEMEKAKVPVEANVPVEVNVPDENTLRRMKTLNIARENAERVRNGEDVAALRLEYGFES